MTRSKLIKQLDSAFSLHIRQRDNYTCFTCGTKSGVMQAGHYFSRANYALRWDERNVHCQCVRCNVFLKGNYPVYAEKLLNKYGKKWLNQLNRDSRQIKKWTTAELRGMIEKLKGETK